MSTLASTINLGVSDVYRLCVEVCIKIKKKKLIITTAVDLSSPTI